MADENKPETREVKPGQDLQERAEGEASPSQRHLPGNGSNGHLRKTKPPLQTEPTTSKNRGHCSADPINKR